MQTQREAFEVCAGLVSGGATEAERVHALYDAKRGAAAIALSVLPYVVTARPAEIWPANIHVVGAAAAYAARYRPVVDVIYTFKAAALDRFIETVG